MSSETKVLTFGNGAYTITDANGNDRVDSGEITTVKNGEITALSDQEAKEAMNRWGISTSLTPSNPKGLPAYKEMLLDRAKASEAHGICIGGIRLTPEMAMPILIDSLLFLLNTSNPVLDPHVGYPFK